MLTNLSTDPDDPMAVPAPTRPRRRRRAGDVWWYSHPAVDTALSIVLALVIGALLIAISDASTRASSAYFFAEPTATFHAAWHAIANGYSAMFRGSILDPRSLSSGSGVSIFRPLSDTLLNATPLVLGGLAVMVAFRAGLFNIGVQGQLIMGAVAAGYVGFAVRLPAGLHLVVAVAAGIIGGALWGGLVGFLKARTGAHEVITTIMLNYVALYLLNFLLSMHGFQQPDTTQSESRAVAGTARLPHLFGDLHVGGIIAVVATACVGWLMSRSTFGFRLRAVGENGRAASAAGIKVSRMWVQVMLVSGALAGLVGCSQILGTSTHLTSDIDGGFGFDAITVALLGRGSATGTLLAGLLFGALRAGGVVMAADTHTPSDIVSVIEPLIVLFIAAPSLVRSIFRLRDPEDRRRPAAPASLMDHGKAA